jgi:enamine deaminase RidA (YjgF/YER057c/UK114 family)
MKIINPFNKEKENDKAQLWEMLVERDSLAFANQNWDMVKDDFIDDHFMGVHAHFESNPDLWRISFPNLELYRDEWLKQAKEFGKENWIEKPIDILIKVTYLDNIEISRNKALLHKKFAGFAEKSNGEKVPFSWQTIYRCVKVDEKWKISGFTGYLPLNEKTGGRPELPTKINPVGSSQHITAGPYSPLLKVNANHIVVISGQASIDNDGNILGDDVEEQTELTIRNCQKQLLSGGASFNDVFKVNVYMKDIKNWDRFNIIYRKYFDDPKPVRTAVETGLIDGLLVEIEMWAAVKN